MRRPGNGYEREWEWVARVSRSRTTLRSERESTRSALNSMVHVDPLSPLVQDEVAPAFQQPEMTAGAVADDDSVTAPDVPAKVEVKVRIMYRRFFECVIAATIFFVGFSVVFFIGVNMQDSVYDSVGSTERSDKLVSRYNAVAGFVNELLQVAVWLGMYQFLPVFRTYWYNLVMPHHHVQQYASTNSPWVSRLRRLVVWMGPMFLIVAIENSSKSFQASQKTIGYDHVIVDSDLDNQVPVELRHNRTVQNRIFKSTRDSLSTAKRHQHEANATIFRTAIQGKAESFTVNLKNATCLHADSADPKYTEVLSLPFNALKSSSVAFGFTPKSWNNDVISKLEPTEVVSIVNSMAVSIDKSSFDAHDLGDLFVQGFSLVEQNAASQILAAMVLCNATKGSNVVERTPIGSNYCLDSTSWLKSVLTRIEDPATYTLDDAVSGVGQLNGSVARYHVSDGVTADAIELEIVNKQNNSYDTYVPCASPADAPGENCTKDYTYDRSLMAHYCGSEGCLLLLKRGALRDQVVIAPYHANCRPKEAKYDQDIGLLVMPGCEAQADSALVVSVATRAGAEAIRVDKAGVAVTKPMRISRISIVRMRWRTENLAAKFRVPCKLGAESCHGVALPINRTGQFLFAGRSALPSALLHQASLASPISLISLTRPFASLKRIAYDVYPLYDANIGTAQKDWKKELAPHCSPFVDAFWNHVAANHYELNDLTQVAYSAALFFLLEKATVTEFGDPATFANSDSKSPLATFSFKGDVQVRSIRLKMPTENQMAAITACCLLVLFSFIAMTSASDPIREWEHVSQAAEYLAISNDDVYADSVHKKILVTSSREECDIDDFEVVQLALTCKHDRQAPPIVL